MTFLELATRTLQQAGIPLTAEEIWQKADEYGFRHLCPSTGRTPWASINAQIYTDMDAKGEHSQFVKIGMRPRKFGLRSNSYAEPIITPPVISTQDRVQDVGMLRERELHSYLSRFVFSDDHFKCYTKTIYNERSSQRQRGEDRWRYPDIVGVRFPFTDYNALTIRLSEALSTNQCKLFSFELKRKISFTNLRECYFQAVSNSSWAHEGYMVAEKYGDESELNDEMLRLNNAFGIGFIKIDTADVEKSSILIPAKIRSELDWNMIHQLSELNPDFQEFIETIPTDLRDKRVRNRSVYDSVED